MSDDMETFENDDDDIAEEDELGIEAPEADAVEQHIELLQHRDEPITGRTTEEADPADAADQRKVVEIDEDDYR